MSGSVNKVILIGNLGRTRSAAAQFRRPGRQLPLATSENWRDKATGERKEKTEWHNVVIFNEKIGKVVEQYCKKGIEGLSRGPVADPQMDRPVRRREIHHRDRAAALPRRIDAARFARAGEGRESFGGGEERAPSFGRSSPVERRPALGRRRGRGRGGADMDDDIPF